MQINKIFNHSSESMHELRDNSVHLIITSPPYNANVGYDSYDDSRPFDEYRDMLKRVWKECFRVLVDGGRIAVNVCAIGKKPYTPLQAFVTVDMIDVGFEMRSEIIWNKEPSIKNSTMWGSYCSATAPVVREEHEYILVFHKHDFKREKNGESTIQPLKFKDCAKSVWNIGAVQGTKIGHPAPFPVELPRRVIQFYSFTHDIVLDPFMGSGTTALAAKELGRNWLGYEVSQEYVNLANDRLRQEMLF